MRRYSTYAQSKTTYAHPQRLYLTPVLSKCLEKFICDWTTDIASDQVDPKQYGSIKGPSSEHALVELVHEWKYALDTPEIRILLVDFSKAFDRVDHHTLTKCTSHGLPNVIIKWLTSFLGQRKQRVKIGDVKSDFTTIRCRCKEQYSALLALYNT